MDFEKYIKSEAQTICNNGTIKVNMSPNAKFKQQQN